MAWQSRATFCRWRKRPPGVAQLRRLQLQHQLHQYLDPLGELKLLYEIESSFAEKFAVRLALLALLAPLPRQDQQDQLGELKCSWILKRAYADKFPVLQVLQVLPVLLGKLMAFQAYLVFANDNIDLLVHQDHQDKFRP